MAFTKIRNGLLEHIRQGKLCPTDLGIYAFLHLTAEWSTGICYTCAAGIAAQFNDPVLKENIQKALRRLRSKGYINYRRGDGQRGSYQILIHKYEPTVGPRCDMRLNAFAEGSLDNPVYEPKNSEAAVETHSSHGQVTVATTVETPIQDLLDVQEKSGSAIAPSRAKAKRACQMSEGFQLKQTHRELAAKLGIDLHAVFEAFCDYHQAKGSMFRDWNKALNTWLRNERKFSRAPASKNGNHSDGAGVPSDYVPKSRKLREERSQEIVAQ